MTPIFALLPGNWEWLIIIFVIILLFGAKKLPDLARALGRSFGEFKKAKKEFDKEMDDALKKDEKTDEKKEPPQG